MQFIPIPSQVESLIQLLFVDTVIPIMFSNLYVRKFPHVDNHMLFCSGCNRPFSYSEKESQSNDTLLHFVEFSNVHNSDRSSNATRSNLVYKSV